MNVYDEQAFNRLLTLVGANDKNAGPHLRADREDTLRRLRSAIADDPTLVLGIHNPYDADREEMPVLHRERLSDLGIEAMANQAVDTLVDAIRRSAAKRLSSSDTVSASDTPEGTARKLKKTLTPRRLGKERDDRLKILSQRAGAALLRNGDEE